MANIRRQLIRQFNRLEAGLIAGLEEVGRDWQTYNRLTVANWRGKPRWIFTVEHQSKSLQLTARVTGPNGPKWYWINKGTGLHGPKKRSYIIRPRPDNPTGMLAFQRDYNPKTRPVAQANVGDGSRSGPLIRTTQVRHPGIPARLFSQHYAESNVDAIIATISRVTKRYLR